MGNPPPLELRRAEDSDLIDVVGNPIFSSELRRRDGNAADESSVLAANMRSLNEMVVPVYVSGFGLVATSAPLPLSIEADRNIRVASTRVSFMDELRRRRSCSISLAAPEQRAKASRLLFMEGFIFLLLSMFEKFDTKSCETRK